MICVYTYMYYSLSLYIYIHTCTYVYTIYIPRDIHSFFFFSVFFLAWFLLAFASHRPHAILSQPNLSPNPPPPAPLAPSAGGPLRPRPGVFAGGPIPPRDPSAGGLHPPPKALSGRAPHHPPFPGPFAGISSALAHWVHEGCAFEFTQREQAQPGIVKCISSVLRWFACDCPFCFRILFRVAYARKCRNTMV